MVALAFAAEATTTLRFGTLVLANDFRHPAPLDQEALTLDALPEGRFELHTRVHVSSVTSDPSDLIGSVAPAFGLEPDQFSESPHLLVGTTEELVDKLVRQREELGISYIGLSIESMEELAPVVSRLAGT